MSGWLQPEGISASTHPGCNSARPWITSAYRVERSCNQDGWKLVSYPDLLHALCSVRSVRSGVLIYVMDVLAENLAGSEDFESARAESTVEGLVCFGLGKGIRDSGSQRVTPASDVTPSNAFPQPEGMAPLSRLRSPVRSCSRSSVLATARPPP